MGFFDGADTDGFCGANIVIKFDKSRTYKGWLKAGLGTNTRAKVIGLWILLYCVRIWG